MADVIQTIQACVESGGSSAADWAQFGATVLGLAVAIAVPNWLHAREAGERKAERDARARTHAIQLLRPLKMLAERLDQLRRDPGSDVRGLADAIAALGTDEPVPDSLPKKIDYLDDSLVQPFFKGIVFHELGDAAEALQVFFNDWQQLSLKANYLRLARAARVPQADINDDEILDRLGHAADLLSQAVDSMYRLFPSGYDAGHGAA